MLLLRNTSLSMQIVLLDRPKICMHSYRFRYLRFYTSGINTVNIYLNTSYSLSICYTPGCQLLVYTVLYRFRPMYRTTYELAMHYDVCTVLQHLSKCCRYAKLECITQKKLIAQKHLTWSTWRVINCLIWFINCGSKCTITAMHCYHQICAGLHAVRGPSHTCPSLSKLLNADLLLLIWRSRQSWY